MQRSCADVNSLCKRKCWTNSGGPLVNSLVWATVSLRKFRTPLQYISSGLLRVIGNYDINFKSENRPVSHYCIKVLHSSAIFYPVQKDTLRLRSYNFYQFCCQNNHNLEVSGLRPPFCFSYPTIPSRSWSAEPPRIPGGSVQRGTCGTHFRLVTSLPFYFLKIPLELLTVSGSHFWQFCKFRKKSPFCSWYKHRPVSFTVLPHMWPLHPITSEFGST